MPDPWTSRSPRAWAGSGRAIRGPACSSPDRPRSSAPAGWSRSPAASTGQPFTGAFMALGDGTQKILVAAAVRKAIGKGDGDEVEVHLTERRG